MEDNVFYSDGDNTFANTTLKHFNVIKQSPAYKKVESSVSKDMEGLVNMDSTPAMLYDKRLDTAQRLKILGDLLHCTLLAAEHRGGYSLNDLNKLKMDFEEDTALQLDSVVMNFEFQTLKSFIQSEAMRPYVRLMQNEEGETVVKGQDMENPLLHQLMHDQVASRDLDEIRKAKEANEYSTRVNLALNDPEVLKNKLKLLEIVHELGGRDIAVDYSRVQRRFEEKHGVTLNKKKSKEMFKVGHAKDMLNDVFNDDLVVKESNEANGALFVKMYETFDKIKEKYENLQNIKQRLDKEKEIKKKQDERSYFNDRKKRPPKGGRQMDFNMPDNVRAASLNQPPSFMSQDTNEEAAESAKKMFAGGDKGGSDDEEQVFSDEEKPVYSDDEKPVYSDEERRAYSDEEDNDGQDQEDGDFYYKATGSAPVKVVAEESNLDDVFGDCDEESSEKEEAETSEDKESEKVSEQESELDKNKETVKKETFNATAVDSAELTAKLNEAFASSDESLESEDSEDERWKPICVERPGETEGVEQVRKLLEEARRSVLKEAQKPIPKEAAKPFAEVNGLCNGNVVTETKIVHKEDKNKIQNSKTVNGDDRNDILIMGMKSNNNIAEFEIVMFVKGLLAGCHPNLMHIDVVVTKLRQFMPQNAIVNDSSVLNRIKDLPFLRVIDGNFVAVVDQTSGR
ncbi:unnamed protein product [Bursaphelenchus okinawaensis]|uniref:Uncharacterized protein n=1 Tax=Bursaphelenchus okinawaensis TaxID=465554 RepID=A0A811LP00_9BILA|nr:unnamed protein product [Bursaphelenchus okinawaensis]CAG9126767.1 unnamed protein product [Bursaphelenchus okinawaensis]